MRRNVLSVAAVIVTLGWTMPALPLMGDHMAGFPVGQPPQWPDGMADVLNSPGRVYGFFFNFGDMFFFAGDAQDFNHFLEGYAKLKGIDPTLTLHSGRGEAGPVHLWVRRDLYVFRGNTRGKLLGGSHV